MHALVVAAYAALEENPLMAGRRDDPDVGGGVQPGRPVTEQTRHQLSGAVREAIIDALEIRAQELTLEEQEWLRRCLAAIVPRATGRALRLIDVQLEVCLASAPRSIFDRLPERRRRADLGME
ncbi:MAG: hypothetical protein ACJ77N_17205 [Chloroflexota bacterium]